MSDVAAQRLFDNKTPETVVADAHERYGPFVARVCLFSGGNDSLAVAHRCRDHYDSLVWVNTGTAVPGVAQFVHHAAKWLEKPLMVYGAMPGEYRRLVMGVGGQQALGFPGPAQHNRCYVQLKERALEAMLRDLKGDDRKARVLALTGIRQSESQRRRNRTDITKRGSLVFANPIIDWSALDLLSYRHNNRLIESDVAAILHRSGECNCGAFAAPGEREQLKALWPEWFEATIGSLERDAEAAGLPACRWGRDDRGVDPRFVQREGEMCSDCQLRFTVSGAAEGDA